MTTTREREIIKAFVDLSNELVEGYDIVDLLVRLTTSCVQLLDVAASGLLLADQQGTLHLVAASSERTHILEAFQLQRDEGPCLDSFHSGREVVAPDLADEVQRWPHFCAAAQAVGFASVHAVPMRLRNVVLGTLGLFGDRRGQLGPDDLALAQALVHVACVAIVNEKASADRDVVNSQLQHALKSRIVVEQAKGVLAQIGHLDMDSGFVALRRYARDHGSKLSDVAARIISRDLDGHVVIDNAAAPRQR